MMKYTFLLLESGHEEFLNRLGELGVVDVSVKDYTPDETDGRMLSDISRYRSTITALERIKSDAGKEEPTHNFYAALSNDEIVDTYNALTVSLEETRADIATLSQTVEETAAWGDFDNESLERLRQEGIELRFFTTSRKNYYENNNGFESQYPVTAIAEKGGEVWFVYVQRSHEERPDSLPDSKEVAPPKESCRIAAAQLDEKTAQKEDLEARLIELFRFVPQLEEQIDDLKEQLHFSKLKKGNVRLAEDSLVLVEGWVPQERTAACDTFFDSLGAVLTFKEKPTIEDEPPVLLRNNRFATSLELITRLYALPKYGEVDMTPFYAPFFVLFVGMCLGDAGYGLLLLLGSLGARIKLKGKYRNITDLVMWCSIAAIFMGTITGVFFGVELATVPALASVKHLFIPTNDMFGYAMAIGLVQILYAQILRSVIRMRNYGFVYGLAGLGWAGTIIFSIAAFALPKAGVEWFSLHSPVYYVLLSICGVCMFFFQNPKKNLFANFGIGIWELYNNVTGLLGDVLSYVRLFALGLSGGVIAGIFNKLAIGMSGDIPVVKYLIMILIILVGHGINIFMSCIGSFVHPLRLTFVEFYKNVGFEGGGRGYDPFVKKNKNV